MTYTTGTKAYSIPLPEPYHFNRAFPLDITHSQNIWVAECLAFSEYGTGETFEDAVQDLGVCIVSLYDITKIFREKTHDHKIGQQLEDFVKLFEESTK